NRFLPFIKQQLTTTSINQLTINFYDHQPSFHVCADVPISHIIIQQKKQQQQQLVSSNGDQIESKDGSDSNDEKDSNRRRLINHQYHHSMNRQKRFNFKRHHQVSIARLSLGRHRRRPAEEVRLKGFGTLDQPTFKQLKEATGNA
ncbi:hypothetical protein BLOT_013511, partial [Blomia tropicalis]